MCPSITVDKLPTITALMKRKFSVVAGFDSEVTEGVWRQVCLPIKSHGCGLGDPYDVITAAFVAHVDETMEAVKKQFPTAAYLDLMHRREDIEQYVLGYRRLKKRIQSTLATLGQEFDEEQGGDEEVSHYFFFLLHVLVGTRRAKTMWRAYRQPRGPHL